MSKPLVRGGALYLPLSGQLELLSRAATGILARLRLEAAEAPVEVGLGFFLCRPRRPDQALDTALALDPPALGFGFGRLTLYRLALGDDPFAAASWRELASAPRPTRRWSDSRPGLHDQA